MRTLLLLLLLGPSAWATAPDCSRLLVSAPIVIGCPPQETDAFECPSMFDLKPDGLAMTFLDLLLERKVCRQVHPELESRGLIMKGGGLCGPTSMAMAIELLRRNGRFEVEGFGEGYELIAQIVERLGRFKSFDPRYGTHDGDFKRLMSELAKAGEASHWLAFEEVSSPRRDQLGLRSDEVALLSFRDENGGRGHMVLLLAFTNHHRALIFDPNYNSHLIRSFVKEDSEKTWLDHYERHEDLPNEITDLLKIRIGSLNRLTSSMRERMQK